jgi:CheY-like chemotaxis protein
MIDDAMSFYASTRCCDASHQQKLPYLKLRLCHYLIYTLGMSQPILLVEDSPNDIEIALFALKKCGVPNNIIVARDGAEALDYLFRRGEFLDRPTGNPGLVLLDLKLPMIDGISVLSAIRHTSWLAGIPVVVLTASALEADVSRTLALGINEYIVKPMDLQVFVDHMCRVASRFVRH